MRLIRWTAVIETPAAVWPVDVVGDRPLVIGAARGSGVELKGLKERHLALTATPEGVQVEVARDAELALNDVPISGQCLARAGDELTLGTAARVLIQAHVVPGASPPVRAPYDELFRRLAAELDRSAGTLVVLAAVPPPLAVSARGAWLRRVTDAAERAAPRIVWGELAADALWGLLPQGNAQALGLALAGAAGARGQVAAVAAEGSDAHDVVGRLWTALYGPQLDAVDPVTADPVMVRLVGLVERLAQADASVAFVGPRGSGRATLARLLAGAAGLSLVEGASAEPGGPHVRLVREAGPEAAKAVAHGERLVVTSTAPLAGFPATITVPGLSSRPLDIGPLAEAYLAQARQVLGRPRLRLTGEVLPVLEAWSWPGNVRELKNVIFRAARSSVRDEIGPDALPADLGEGSPREDLRNAVLARERQLLLDALARTRWNVTAASARLGMPRRTVVYRMRRLGLKRPARESHRR